MTARSRVCRLVFVTLSLGSIAEARETRAGRPWFEPTDLELEEPGIADLDVEFGATRGDLPNGNRLVLPDFEVDLGLTSNVELDIDGAFGLARFDQPSRETTADPLWIATKLGLYDGRLSPKSAVAAGLQLGPRLPTIGMAGIGYAALGLVGFYRERTHLVLNFGGIIDPGPQIARGQQESVVAGVDLDLDLDALGLWSLAGELAGAHYFSPDPDQFTLSAGITLAATPNLDVYSTVLAGFLPGGDRLAAFVGVSPKFAMW
jgi:hypothetical protein